MRTPRSRSGPRSGFSMVEIVITLVIASLLATGAVLAAGESGDAFRDTRQRSALEARLRRALDRAQRELLDTGDEVLIPNPTGVLGTADLRFRRAEGLDGDAIEWGVAQRLLFEHEPDEADDGADNDGDGLVDEGVLVLVRDEGGAEETRVVLCHGVRELAEGETENLADDNGNGLEDEGGFNVQRVGDVLILRLTLEEPHRLTRSIVRSMTSTVRVRNLQP